MVLDSVTEMKDNKKVLEIKKDVSKTCISSQPTETMDMNMIENIIFVLLFLLLFFLIYDNFFYLPPIGQFIVNAPARRAEAMASTAEAMARLVASRLLAFGACQRVMLEMAGKMKKKIAKKEIERDEMAAKTMLMLGHKKMNSTENFSLMFFLSP